MYELYSSTQSTVDISKVTFHWSARFICLLFQYYTILFRKEMEIYCRQNSNLHERLKGKRWLFCSKNFRKKSLIVTGIYPVPNKEDRGPSYSTTACRMIHLGFFAVHFYPCFPALNLFLDPSSVIKYWPSRFIPEGTLWSLAWKIPFILIEWYVAASTMFVVAFVIIVIIIHVNVLKFGLELLRWDIMNMCRNQEFNKWFLDLNLEKLTDR